MSLIPTTPGGLGDGQLVGGDFDFQVRLLLDDQDLAGTFDIVLRWGDERELYPFQVGALILRGLPSVPTSSDFMSTVLGDDCLAGIGPLIGACTLSATVHQATPGVSRLVGSFQFNYRWIPEPGFEICLGLGFNGCVEAGQLAGVSAVLVGGASGPFLWTTTLGQPGVRPIPEPTTATLTAIGLGLLGLGGRRFDASAKRKSARPISAWTRKCGPLGARRQGVRHFGATAQNMDRARPGPAELHSAL